MIPAAALFVARIDPATGLPVCGANMTPFDDLAQARVRAATLTNLSAQMGRDHRFGVWRIEREFAADVTLAASTQQVQP